MSKKNILLLVVLLLCAVCTYAQNSNNYITVTSNTSLNFAVNTVARVESGYPIPAAITIKVKNRTNPPATRSVYVRASTFTPPAGFTAPSIPLQLDYTSDNSSNETNLITTAFTVTTTDQRMFTHNAHASNSEYSFNYDLLISATNWDFPPGTYNYTLTFTFPTP